MRHALTPFAIRARIASMVADAAKERELDGDPEGAGVLRDLAQRIRRVRLTEER